MKNPKLKQLSLLFAGIAGLLICSCPCNAAPAGAEPAGHDHFFALPIAKGDAACPRALYRYGVPFIETAWRAPAGGSLQVSVGVQARKIFLLGMTETLRTRVWAPAMSYAGRYFVGDNLGEVRLHYVDGSTQNFPLIMGESVWWGLPFYQTRGAFPTDARLRAAFEQAMRLYPAAPVDDGNYVAVIQPRSTPLASIEITGSPAKMGSVAITGITVESALGAAIAGATEIPVADFSPEFSRFMRKKPLRPEGVDESGSRQRLNDLSQTFYTTDADFKHPIPPQIPRGYSGPRVTFKGSAYASALQNAFYANLQDMLDKFDADGTFHTSTRGALSWGGVPHSAGGEFGAYRRDVGIYYDEAWSRDLGRNIQELSELGFLDKASNASDFALRSARSWSQNPALKYRGSSLPPHWSRIINKPDFSLPLENDGHGLISLSLYKVWQRVPHRDAWLRAHWADVKLAGDWIPWQFDHPEISGAANGVLYTTGESAGGSGYSVYPDTVCMDALFALAQMADSIGEAQSAALWRDRAEKMLQAIPARYLITDPKYGRVWTLDHAGWPNQSTVLGPLIFLADSKGFMPQDDDPAWRPANQAAYRRLIDSYRPFGFYGFATGYGQGFVTQAALLLDRMQDVTPMLDWAAREVYVPGINSFLVPEGAQLDPSGHFIFRTGDSGNAVQEAEFVKLFRILIGVDDVQPQRLRIVPRLPYGWTEIAIDKYPALVERQGKTETAYLRYALRRTAGRMDLAISADRDLGLVAMRLGPFATQPQASDVLVNGKHPAEPAIQKSGDSWWVSFTAPVGPVLAAAKK